MYVLVILLSLFDALVISKIADPNYLSSRMLQNTIGKNDNEIVMSYKNYNVIQNILALAIARFCYMHV